MKSSAEREVNDENKVEDVWKKVARISRSSRRSTKLRGNFWRRKFNSDPENVHRDQVQTINDGNDMSSFNKNQDKIATSLSLVPQASAYGYTSPAINDRNPESCNAKSVDDFTPFKTDGAGSYVMVDEIYLSEAIDSVPTTKSSEGIQTTNTTSLISDFQFNWKLKPISSRGGMFFMFLVVLLYVLRYIWKSQTTQKNSVAPGKAQLIISKNKEMISTQDDDSSSRRIISIGSNVLVFCKEFASLQQYEEEWRSRNSQAQGDALADPTTDLSASPGSGGRWLPAVISCDHGDNTFDIVCAHGPVACRVPRDCLRFDDEIDSMNSSDSDHSLLKGNTINEVGNVDPALADLAMTATISPSPMIVSVMETAGGSSGSSSSSSDHCNHSNAEKRPAVSPPRNSPVKDQAAFSPSPEPTPERLEGPQGGQPRPELGHDYGHSPEVAHAPQAHQSQQSQQEVGGSGNRAAYTSQFPQFASPTIEGMKTRRIFGTVPDDIAFALRGSTDRPQPPPFPIPAVSTRGPCGEVAPREPGGLEDPGAVGTTGAPVSMQSNHGRSSSRQAAADVPTAAAGGRRVQRAAASTSVFSSVIFPTVSFRALSRASSFDTRDDAQSAIHTSVFGSDCGSDADAAADNGADDVDSVDDFERLSPSHGDNVNGDNVGVDGDAPAWHIVSRLEDDGCYGNTRGLISAGNRRPDTSTWATVEAKLGDKAGAESGPESGAVQWATEPSPAPPVRVNVLSALESPSATNTTTAESAASI